MTERSRSAPVRIRGMEHVLVAPGVRSNLGPPRRLYVRRAAQGVGAIVPARASRLERITRPSVEPSSE